jgi:hypothetical protein
MHPRASFAFALLGCSLIVHAAEAPHSESAQQLVADVIYNELHDRECDSFWKYRSARQAGGQDMVREQVETAEGPIYEVLEDHGSPLDTDERRREDLRLDDLIRSPAAMEKLEQKHRQSEERLKSVMDLLPKAFLFAYEGPSEGDAVRISFTPNPSFRPETYEARIVHAMRGALLVDRRLKRIIEMDGHILQRVNFGYGFLGYVEKGGTYRICRVRVSQTHWKTSLVDVHVQGKVLLFESVEKEQRESRSGFYPVPHDISLEQAKRLLNSAANKAQIDLSAKLSGTGR